MTSPPSWWSTTTASTKAELGITWRPTDQWAAEEQGETYLGTMRTEDDVTLDTRLRAGKLLVGTGPEVITRGMGIEQEVHWYLDPSDPSKLWCALADFYPAWLWVPVEPEPAALAEVLSHSHPRPSLTQRELGSFTRGLLGFRSEVRVPHVYSGDLVEFNGHDLDRYFVGVQFAEQSFWGSHWQDDPLRDDVGVLSPLASLAAARDTNSQAQQLGRVPSMTWRTLHSRSYLSFEVHTHAVVCAAVRYRPSPSSHRPVVERLNAELDHDFPTDLPLDVIGALCGFDFSSEQDVAVNITDPRSAEQLATGLRIHAALWCGDQRRSQRLREYADHSDPVVRMQLARIAYWYDYRWLAEELALTETDPDLRAQVEDLVIKGPEPDTFNAFGDYFSDKPVLVDRAGRPVETWSSEDEDDEDDEDAYEDEDEDERDDQDAEEQA